MLNILGRNNKLNFRLPQECSLSLLKIPIGHQCVEIKVYEKGIRKPMIENIRDVQQNDGETSKHFSAVVASQLLLRQTAKMDYYLYWLYRCISEEHFHCLGSADTHPD